MSRKIKTSLVFAALLTYKKNYMYRNSFKIPVYLFFLRHHRYAYYNIIINYHLQCNVNRTWENISNWPMIAKKIGFGCDFGVPQIRGSWFRNIWQSSFWLLARGKSLLESWGTTFFPDRQSIVLLMHNR